MIVHQWIPAAHAGDAVGDNARALRDLFRRHGHESDIFALTIDRRASRATIRPWSDPASRGAGRHAPALRGSLADDRRASRRCQGCACSSITTSRRRSSSRPSTKAFFGSRRSAAVSWRRSSIALIWRRACPSSTGASSRRSGFRRPPCVPLLVDVTRLTGADPVPSARDAAPGRSREHPVRRPAGAEQEDRRSHPAGGAVQALRRRLLPVHLRWESTTRSRGTSRPSGR